MTDSHIELYLNSVRGYFPAEMMPYVNQKLKDIDDKYFCDLSSVKLLEPYNVLLVSIFAGPIGIDRFMLDDWLLGTIKTLTCGGLLIWAFIDCLYIEKLTRKRNLYIFDQFVLCHQ